MTEIKSVGEIFAEVEAEALEAARTPEALAADAARAAERASRDPGPNDVYELDPDYEFEGAEAYRDGLSRSDCPYEQPGSFERYRWLSGYTEAQDEDNDEEID